MKAVMMSDSAFRCTSRIKANMLVSLTDKKRIIAVIAPLILMASMYPVFHLLVEALANDRVAWYLGLAIYWLIWGAVFPLVIIGKENIKALLKPQKLSKKMLLLMAIPLLGAVGARLVPGMPGYEKTSLWILILIFSTTVGNGFFEEVLWRGVYVTLFPDSIFYRMIWPGIWFGVWHFVPVSVLGGNLLGMMIGPVAMGLYLSYLTKKTGTLQWAILTHFLGGIIMVSW
ncbi:MAG: CPBP family intramembrane metalloprotease [Dehalococcoidales bacterium]|nr:MAG: CPBP family intramembrane metalloprotease [Dehalococcoidales bacterium]